MLKLIIVLCGLDTGGFENIQDHICDQLHTKTIPVLNSMFRLGLVGTLVSHANIKGFGQTSLSGVRHDTV